VAKPLETTAPKRGSVIRYAYLWADENKRGQTEGRKDRPAVVIALSIRKESGQYGVLVAAITHSQPRHAQDAVPLPLQTKRELGLDSEPAWVVTTEANAFTWPGYDIRFISGRNPLTSVYGKISDDLLRRITASYLANADKKRTQIVVRNT
jgi:hypothetical protein